MPAARFLPLAGVSRGVSPRPDEARFWPPFLGTKNTSGYPDQDTAGMVNASIKGREIRRVSGCPRPGFRDTETLLATPAEPARSALAGGMQRGRAAGPRCQEACIPTHIL